MAVPEQVLYEKGQQGNWGEKLGEAIAVGMKPRDVGYDDPDAQETVELGPNETVPEGATAIKSEAASRKFGYGNLGNQNIFSTIDKILTGGQDYVNQNMPGFSSGVQDANTGGKQGASMGITRYKNGEIVNGNGNGVHTTSSGGQFNIPRVMTPLVASLHKGLTDDKGIFQGGREGRVFGRLKDFMGDTYSSLTKQNQNMTNQPAHMQTEQTHGSSYLTSPEEAAANQGQTTPQFDVENPEEVANVQNMLIDLGYMSGDAESGEGADGQFGPNTTAAWQAYANDRRKHQGLDPYTYDGVTDGTQTTGQDADEENIIDASDTTNKDSYGYGTEVSEQPTIYGKMGSMQHGQTYEIEVDGKMTSFDWSDPQGPIGMIEAIDNAEWSGMSTSDKQKLADSLGLSVGMIDGFKNSQININNEPPMGPTISSTNRTFREGDWRAGNRYGA